MKQIKDYLSISQVAKRLGVSRQRVWALIDEGRLEVCCDFPAMVLVSLASLRRLRRNPTGVHLSAKTR